MTSGSGETVPVDDPDDPRLADYRHLNDPAGRRRHEADGGIFVVEGKLAVERLLESSVRIRSLLVDDRQGAAPGGLVDRMRARGVPVFVGTRDVVAATVGFSLHRGVVAVAHRPADADPAAVVAGALRGREAGGPVVVAVLEGLNDHENVGALFRNAAAFGVGGVLLDPTCADPLYRRSVRVSMGHVLHVPFARVDRWPDGLADLRTAGLVVAALAPRPGGSGGGGCPAPATSLVELRARLAGPRAPVGVALVLGAEGPGLSEATLATADVAVSIPMAGGVDSLNVATAAAVAFHALMGE